MPPAIFTATGVSGTPKNQRWRIGKTDGKIVSPGIFPRFFRFKFFLGVLGACSPKPVPRASEVAAVLARGHAPQSRSQNQADAKTRASEIARGAIFGSFLVTQKAAPSGGAKLCVVFRKPHHPKSLFPARRHRRPDIQHRPAAVPPGCGSPTARRSRAARVVGGGHVHVAVTYVQHIPVAAGHTQGWHQGAGTLRGGFGGYARAAHPG